MSGPTFALTAVLPYYNERDNIELLLTRLMPVLEEVANGQFELIFVDDGSSDGSEEILDALATRDNRIKVLHLSRNFGHQAALSAGLEAASGDAVVLMDADLQDPPEVIRSFVARWREGYDVVYGTRRERKEGILKRMAFAFFYRSLRVIAEINVPLDAGDFCLLDRNVVDAMIRLREHHRFLRGLRSWLGFRQTGVPYEREARHAGMPKFTLSKLISLALSGYVGFSSKPLRAATWLGFAAAGAGFLLAVWAIVTNLMGIPSPKGWASILGVVLFIGGVQLLILGIIGEYLGRVYDEVRQRPAYIVRRRVGFHVAPASGEQTAAPGAAAGTGAWPRTLTDPACSAEASPSRPASEVQ